MVAISSRGETKIEWNPGNKWRHGKICFKKNRYPVPGREWLMGIKRQLTNNYVWDTIENDAWIKEVSDITNVEISAIQAFCETAIRAQLAETLQDLRAEKCEARFANTVANVARTWMASVSLEMRYNKMLGKAPKSDAFGI